MKTPQSKVLNATPAIEQSIATIEAEKTALHSKFRKRCFASLFLTFAGVLLLILGAAFFPASIAVAAVAVALFVVAAVLALCGATFETKFYVLNRKSLKLKAVVSALNDAGFQYGNHKPYFGRWIFEERNGARFAAVDPNAPADPFVIENNAALSLNLDGRLSFAAHVGAPAPDARNFNVHPDYRYRINKQPLYERAALRIGAGTKDPLLISFTFGNRNRREFLQLIGELCG